MYTVTVIKATIVNGKAITRWRAESNKNWFEGDYELGNNTLAECVIDLIRTATKRHVRGVFLEGWPWKIG